MDNGWADGMFRKVIAGAAALVAVFMIGAGPAAAATANTVQRYCTTGSYGANTAVTYSTYIGASGERRTNLVSVTGGLSPRVAGIDYQLVMKDGSGNVVYDSGHRTTAGSSFAYTTSPHPSVAGNAIIYAYEGKDGDGAGMCANALFTYWVGP